MRLSRLVRFGVDILFPPRCVFCGGIVAPGTEICGNCAKEIVPSGTGGCVSIPVRDRDVPCAFLYPYEGKVRDSMLRYKFHGQKQYAGFYARELAGRIGGARRGERLDLVTSVPLSDGRLRERGYNQSELIAKPVARALGLPYVRCLRKTRPNGVQHLLSREQRLRNVRGVYSLCGEPVRGKRVLLIDDIVTTGSTLAECSAVLLEGGAAGVACAAVARSAPEQS
ncbi:MAG: ComF family protein [Oscillospiraceae bacterium]|nr:ComF family protein [Oscillospiraceae bacterium]MCI1990630.1 ComF family protein [Oscillospiraceae bacterium]MCI2036345.1 ComF family protein [Oscillospiraceae bacterium]